MTICEGLILSKKGLSICAQIKSVIDNDELPENQVEIDGKDWLNIATFMKEDPKLSFDQLECITGVDTGEEGPLQTHYNLHSMEHLHKKEDVINQNLNLGNIINIAKEYLNYESNEKDLKHIIEDKSNDTEIIDMGYPFPIDFPYTTISALILSSL